MTGPRDLDPDGAITDIGGPGGPVPDDDAVLRDDVLVNALAKGVLPLEHQEDPLVHALLDWREDLLVPAGESTSDAGGFTATSTRPFSAVTDPPASEAPTTPFAKVNGHHRHDDTVDELAERRRRRGLRITKRTGVAAAVFVLGMASVTGVAAASVAEPGDPLWPLAKVVNSERAESLEAKEAALDQLRDAEQAAQERRAGTARQHLDEAMDKAQRVRDKDGQEELRKQAEELREKLNTIDGSPAAPSGPVGASPSPSVPSPSAGTPSPSAPSPSDGGSPSSPAPSSSAAPATPTATPGTSTKAAQVEPPLAGQP